MTVAVAAQSARVALVQRRLPRKALAGGPKGLKAFPVSRGHEGHCGELIPQRAEVSQWRPGRTNLSE